MDFFNQLAIGIIIKTEGFKNFFAGIKKVNDDDKDGDINKKLYRRLNAISQSFIFCEKEEDFEAVLEELENIKQELELLITNESVVQ